jgi:cyanophycinase-like exopeptidase
MWIRDEMRMFAEVIPLAAKRAAITDVTWIAEAARANFRRYLTAASGTFLPSERDDVTPLFQRWADTVAEQDLLERFMKGDTIVSPTSLLMRAKALIRPVAQQLAPWLRR